MMRFTTACSVMKATTYIVPLQSDEALLCHFCVTYLHNSMQTMQTVGTVQTAPFSCKFLILQ
jgi:hypothetical protein